jgi:type IV pilus assembly protein PilW
MIELLVTLLVSSVIAGAALSITLSTRELLAKDQSRSQISQDLRLGLDLLGVDVRQAGERLPEDFPAVEIIDGAGGPDTLVLRRNLLAAVLPVCEQIDQATTTEEVRIAKDGTAAPQGCPPVPDENTDGWPDNLEAWRAYRTAQGGAVKAYVYNPVAHQGEFFVYDGDGSTTHFIHKTDDGSWANTYGTTQQCRIYVIEERRYTLQGDVLQYTVNGETGTPHGIIHGVTDFQVRAELADGSMVDALGAADRWSAISAVEISVRGVTNVDGEVLERNVSSRFFPRNVLSL